MAGKIVIVATVAALYVAGFFSGAVAFVWYLKNQHPEITAALVRKIEERKGRKHVDT